MVDSISTNPPLKKRKLKKVKYLRLDISKKKKLFNKLSKNYDYIVNLAGYVDHSDKQKTMKREDLIKNMLDSNKLPLN